MAPTGAAPTPSGRPPGRVTGARPDHPGGLRAPCRCRCRRRGPRLRPGGRDRGALPGPDRPVHPLRDGRRRGAGGRRPGRPGAKPRRSAVGRGHRGRLRRRRVRPAGAAAAVGQGPGLRRPVPVHRLVLRGKHRPDLHPRRLQGPLRRAQRRRPAGWTRSRTAAGNPARQPGPVCGGTEAPLARTPWSASCSRDAV